MKNENKKQTETRAPTSHIAPFGLRMQPDLRERLENSASKNGRSLNAEITDRLLESFAHEHLRPGDVTPSTFVRIPAIKEGLPEINLPIQFLGTSFFGGNFAYFVVNGDSMYPTLTSGDIVILDTSIDPIHGKIIIVSNDIGETFVRRFIKNGKDITFTTDNPNYLPIQNGEVGFFVCGTVICSISSM